MALCRCGGGYPPLQPLSRVRAAGMARGGCAAVAWPVQGASGVSFALPWGPSWPRQPRDGVSWDAAVAVACRVREHPCSRPPRQSGDRGRAGRALLSQGTCRCGPSPSLRSPPVPREGFAPVQAGGEGCSATGSGEPGVMEINGCQHAGCLSRAADAQRGASAQHGMSPTA